MKYNNIKIRMFGYDDQVIDFSEYSSDLVLAPEGEYTFEYLEKLMLCYSKLMDERKAEGARVYCNDGSRDGYAYWDNETKKLGAWCPVKSEYNNPTECYIFNMMTCKYEEGVLYDEGMNHMSVVVNDDRYYLGEHCKMWCDDPEDDQVNWVFSKSRVYIGNGLIVSQDYNALQNEVCTWLDVVKDAPIIYSEK